MGAGVRAVRRRPAWAGWVGRGVSRRGRGLAGGVGSAVGPVVEIWMEVIMLKTLEAVIDVQGGVRLLERIRLPVTRRALVIVLGDC